MESISLPFTQREHFLVDPVFAQCWTLMEKERFLPPGEKSETGGTFVEIDGKPIVELPWSWNTLGRMLEYVRNVAPKDEISTEVETWKFSYKILLDVQHFLPAELSITLTDRTIVVKGKHEEREDPDGAVSREFSRKYILPADALMDAIECNLSSDGVLHVLIPRHFGPDKCPRRQSLKDSIKSTFSSLIGCTNPNVTEGKVIHPPPQEGRENSPPKPIVDEPIHNLIQGLSDFDRIPFWSRQSMNTSQFGIKSDHDMFKAMIDVRQYTPEELTVYKTPHHIFVEGTHEDLPDEHGLVQHYFHFTRKYSLPGGVNAEGIRCRWKWNGALEITVPKACPQVNEKVVLIPILVGDIEQIPIEEDAKLEQQTTEKEEVEHADKEVKKREIPVMDVKKIDLPDMKEKKIPSPVIKDDKIEVPVMDVKRIDLLITEDKKMDKKFDLESKTEFPDMEIKKTKHHPVIDAEKIDQLPVADEAIPILDDKKVEKVPLSEELKTVMEDKNTEEITPTTELPKDEKLPMSEDLKPVMGEEFVKQLTVSEIVNTPMEDWKLKDEQLPAYEHIKPEPDMKGKKTEEHPVSEDSHTEDKVSREGRPIALGF